MKTEPSYPSTKAQATSEGGDPYYYIGEGASHVKIQQDSSEGASRAASSHGEGASHAAVKTDQDGLDLLFGQVASVCNKLGCPQDWHRLRLRQKCRCVSNAVSPSQAMARPLAAGQRGRDYHHVGLHVDSARHGQLPVGSSAKRPTRQSVGTRTQHIGSVVEPR